MATQLFWIDGLAARRLAILARPRANDWLTDDVEHWKAEGLAAVICLLERDEIHDLGLQSEKLCCEAVAIEFISYPIPDRGVPNSVKETRALAELVVRKLNDGQKIGVHCRAGIGRSAIITASILSVLGHHPDEAFKLIGEARGLRVPDTDDQRHWLTLFAANS
jgi:protein-tyrosine phosphatase